MLPDSPRYYASVGRLQEARDVLEHVRGGSSAAVEEEYLEICARADGTKPSSPIQFAKVLLGRGEGKAAHLGRRAWLCIWLQIMASWTGITVSLSDRYCSSDQSLTMGAHRRLRHIPRFS